MKDSLRFINERFLRLASFSAGFSFATYRKYVSKKTLARPYPSKKSLVYKAQTYSTGMLRKMDVSACGIAETKFFL